MYSQEKTLYNIEDAAAGPPMEIPPVENEVPDDPHRISGSSGIMRIISIVRSLSMSLQPEIPALYDRRAGSGA